MSVYEIKSYLFPENVQVSVSNIHEANEIRRFMIPTQPNGIYENLLQKLQQAYGSLLPVDKSEIKTYWKDEENEFVGFSTDNELTYAIDLVNLNRLNKPYESSHPVFKVFVSKKSQIKTENIFGKQEQSKQQQQTPKQEDVFHPGVTCDGCNGSIYGMRYKCKTCPDYDLCSKCHGNKFHSEHLFQEIQRPFSYRCPFTNNRQGQPRTDPLTHAFNSFMPMLSRGIPVVNDPDQLKFVGEYLKAFLDPFGIDVDYHVEQRTKEKEANNKAKDEKMKTEEKPQEKSNEQSFPSNVQEPINPATIFINSLIERNAAKSTNNSHEHTMEWIKVQPPTEELHKEPVKDTQKEVQSNVAIATSAPLSSTPNVAMTSNVSEKASAYSAAIPNTSAYSGSSPYAFATQALSQAITNLNIKQPAPDQSNQKPSEINVNEDGFNVIDIDSKEMKIVNAVEQLKSMGYTDEYGWLTRLVTSKDGDLNAVLDAITYRYN